MTLSPVYEVLSPQGEAVSASSPSSNATALDAFAGRRIGLFWNGFTNGNLLLESLARLFERRFPGTTFIKLPAGRDLGWGHYPERSLTDVVREYGIDAAIAGPGC